MTGSALRATAARAQEFAFEPRDHEAISKLAYAEAGILLPAGKSQLVYGRLAKRVRACGLESFAQYVELLDSDMAERGRAIDALTTNHTKFFREDHHFDHVRDTLWPVLQRKLNGGGSVRFWSAACSSGEEPYTLAMTLLGADKTVGTKIARSNVKILATDLSDTILAAARTGRYPIDQATDIPGSLRNAWLRKSGDQFEIDPACRDMVSFKKLNLLTEWPIKTQFDAIFCRNVMIYFDEETKERLVRRLAERLVPGGFLYIGHSERVAPSLSHMLTCVGRTIFQKVS
jgi:chemotaxis protein methyltransferase CheR